METNSENKSSENSISQNDLKYVWKSIKQFIIELLDIRLDTDSKGTIEDIKGRRTILDSVVPAGHTAIINLKGSGTNLINTGGTLILFDHENDPIDIVSYSRNDASNEGWTIVF